jgi:hypothetical protein
MNSKTTATILIALCMSAQLTAAASVWMHCERQKPAIQAFMVLQAMLAVASIAFLIMQLPT